MSRGHLSGAEVAVGGNKGALQGSYPQGGLGPGRGSKLFKIVLALALFEAYTIVYNE